MFKEEFLDYWKFPALEFTCKAAENLQRCLRLADVLGLYQIEN
jgi:hypothetical protein